MTNSKSNLIPKAIELFESGKMLKEIQSLLSINHTTLTKYMVNYYGKEKLKQKCLENAKPNRRTGSDHWQWNGGKELTKKGYVRIWINGKRVFEHRYNYELHTGTKIKPNEHIHHINGIKTDNRIKNLRLMNTIEHMKLHNLTKTPLIPRDKAGRFTTS